MDLRFTELMPAAQIVVEECMKVRPDEKVVLVTDNRISDYFGTEPLIQALMAALRMSGCDVSLMSWTARERNGLAVPALADDTILAADAVICLNTCQFIQAEITNKALIAGTRFMYLPGGINVRRTDDKLYRVLPKSKEEYFEIYNLTERVGAEFLGGRKKVHFTAPSGTDLTFEIGPELAQSICSGDCSRPGTTSALPNGQLAFGIIPGTANGVIAIDASIAPLPDILTEPIVFPVKGGHFTAIEGGAHADEFRKVVEKCPYPGRSAIAEFGMGLNPRAEIRGDSFEDECYFGAGHIGFGANTSFGGDIFTDGFHCDGVALNATVKIDGKLICENGKFLV